MRGLQHAIEDVNGVTFRDADTEIRSKFGVYQTRARSRMYTKILSW